MAISLKRIAEHWYRKKALLILSNDAVCSSVIGLLEDVFIIGNILKLNSKFHSAAAEVLSIRNFQVSSEIC